MAAEAKMAEDDEPGSALSLKWTFGFNKDIVGGVHNLSDDTRSALFYVAAHTGVIYDFQTRTQKLLQGHCNPISCACASPDKRWVATADKGPDSMVVVWDSVNAAPLKTLFDPHPCGVAAMDMSTDAMFLATLSEPDPSAGGKQFVAVWEWTTDRQGPLYVAEVPAIKDPQHCIKFNSNDARELVTNGTQRAVFWSWERRKLEATTPVISQSDFMQTIGNLTQSCFLTGGTSAITATVDGDVILWDKSMAGATTRDAPSQARRAVKIIRLSEQGAILFVTVANNYIVTGSADGAVRFYDLRFRVEAWFEDLNAGPITSVSFANSAPRPSMPDGDSDVFMVPDFICGSSKALVVGVEASLCEEVDQERRRGVLLVQGIDSRIVGVATHPNKPWLAVASASGTLQLWDMEARRLLMVRCFEPSQGEPVSLAFEPKGRYLAQGMADGKVFCMAPKKFTDLENGSFHNAAGAVKLIRFSSDGAFMATADSDRCVGVYRYMEDEREWVYLGKHRAHWAPITGLEFGVGTDGQPLLASVGDDQRIVSYDLERSSVKDGIVLKRPGTGPSSQAAKGAAAARAISTHQTAKPTACLWHPQSPESKEDIFIVANDNFKFSLWSPAHSACRRTALGPTYGGPITKLLLLPAKSPGAAAQYMAYATQDKVVGLVKLPLDGNPNKAVGLIAHPAEVSNVAVSHDGRFLVTAGASDMTVNVWQVDTTVLDVAVEAGGDNLEPFLGLLDGGRDGEFFQDLRDYFCLSQLRTQGESTTAPRRVTGSTQVSEIPNLMRALGFYPSKHEIARMCDEVKYVDVVQTGNVADSVSLADFVKLYVNHRPVEGVSKADVEDAFQVLREALDADGGAEAAETGTMPWQKVLTQLRSNGEKMGDVELQTCLRALMGDEQFNLPADIGPLDFAHSVLGFEDYQEG